MCNSYTVICHRNLLFFGTVDPRHHIFAVKHACTALDDQIIFGKVIRKIGSAYQLYLQVFSKSFFSIRGIFTLPISSFRGACVQHSAIST